MQTILLVDDEFAYLSTISKRYFRRLFCNKYHILFTSSGEEALRIVKKIPVNLILLDIIMPKMDGLTTLQKLKQITQAKIVVLSAVTTLDIVQQVIKLGAVKFIPKNADMKKLLKVVAVLMKKERLCSGHIGPRHTAMI